MSNVNIKRAVDNIRTSTTVYTPLVEMIVNAIQAIDESNRQDGKVSIRTIRNSQTELDGTLPNVTGFKIQDNGIGFTDEHRISFDTLYTDHRIAEGGKGFGRFTCLKYFENLHVKSVYREGSEFKSRRFSMGKDFDIIVREKITGSQHKVSGSIVSLTALRGARSSRRNFLRLPETLWNAFSRISSRRTINARRLYFPSTTVVTRYA